MDKSLFERLVNFRPKLSNIDIHNIGQSFETLIPYMFNNHGPRKNATRVDRQIFQQCILFGRKSDRQTFSPNLMIQPINLQIAYAYTV
jgi:hypothetical protein